MVLDIGIGSGKPKQKPFMTPDRLIDWAVSITVCIMIVSITGIQDWVAKLFGSKYTKRELEEKVATLESRIEKLEKAD
jgi:hypothetical protein